MKLPCRHASLERSTARQAFTLVELLVVIGIIAVLVGILLPALSRARLQAQTVQCQANLRSIGQALRIYASSHQDSMPFGDFLDPVNTWNANSDTANWSVRVATALSKGKLGENFTNTTTSKGIFKCPSAVQFASEAPDRFVLHYTAHPRLMPGYSTYNDAFTKKRQLPFRFGKIKNSTEIILVFDGTQYLGATGTWDGNAHPLGSGLDNWRCGVPYAGTNGWGNALLNPCPPVNFWDNGYDKPLDNIVNLDAMGYNGAQQQNIRFRHGRNDTSNVLFCDGHVGSFHIKANLKRSDGTYPTDLLRRNICVTWP